MSKAIVGESLPANTPHATSVSLPTWKANVGYEEGERWVVDNMSTGYPRFFIHKLITAFANDISQKYSNGEQDAILFPSTSAAKRCVEFISTRDPSSQTHRVQIVELRLNASRKVPEILVKISPSISAVLLPRGCFPVAKEYWQHSGDGISSRRAEFCHGLFREGLLVEPTAPRQFVWRMPLPSKGPKRYQRSLSIDNTHGGSEANAGSLMEKDCVPKDCDHIESSEFVEERFGRNLDITYSDNAKSALRRRIAGYLTTAVNLEVPMSPVKGTSTREVEGISEDDVFLYSCGMNSIFNAHQMMLETRGPMKSVMFGFPYVDTLKILEKFGPGCLFYGRGSSEDLEDFERRLKNGEEYLALFCEFPGNPLLESPDLQRIKRLSEEYNFGVVVDETIGNFVNVNVLPYADIVVSSLTKVFAGECNVMGGSAILNPKGRYYSKLREVYIARHEDNYWAEDVIFMERNSRDFSTRAERINQNAEIICELLKAHPLVKSVYYPKFASSRTFYDVCKTPNGGYGGLFSVEFLKENQAMAFFDRIEIAKGPSLGTNFTLASPYVILAHYAELQWAATFGIESHLVRVSVGLEDADHLRAVFQEALRATENCAQQAV